MLCYLRSTFSFLDKEYFEKEIFDIHWRYFYQDDEVIIWAFVVAGLDNERRTVQLLFIGKIKARGKVSPLSLPIAIIININIYEPS